MCFGERTLIPGETIALSICTRFFYNLHFTKLIYELDCLSISNLIFAGYTGSKNKV